jgi:hypothetical protein
LIVCEDTSIEAAEKREWVDLDQQETAATVIIHLQVE